MFFSKKLRLASAFLGVAMLGSVFAGCGSDAGSGDTIKVAFDTSRMHIFDKDTERCIVH